MTDDIQGPIELSIKYDEEFKQQVTGDGRSYNPLANLIIRVGDTAISGPEKGYTGVYLLNFLGEALDAVEKMRQDEKKIIMTGDGPTYIVFEPKNENEVVFAECFTKSGAEEPEERLSIEPEVVVSKQALIEEILRFSTEVIDEIISLDPDVANHNQIREFREYLQEIKGAQ